MVFADLDNSVIAEGSRALTFAVQPRIFSLAWKSSEVNEMEVFKIVDEHPFQ
jgi:hypothetical protein